MPRETDNRKAGQARCAGDRHGDLTAGVELGRVDGRAHLLATDPSLSQGIRRFGRGIRLRLTGRRGQRGSAGRRSRGLLDQLPSVRDSTEPNDQ